MPAKSNPKRRIFTFRACVLLGVLFALIFGRLYFKVTERFDHRRWNLPSRVYADSFPLYDGRPLTTAELDDKLAHLDYLPVTDTPDQQGEYRKQGARYEVFLHDFDYPHEKFKGFTVNFGVTGAMVKGLKNFGGETVALVNLEPELIASIFDEYMEDRTVVAIKDVPEHLQKAVIAIEDERFYFHFGVDPVGIIRAMGVNIQAGGFVQGGSTITQQLIKNFFLHQRKTLGRKFEEMVMAVMMEIRYSKKEILESYLNEIYLGQRGAASISGMQEASRFYFSKNVGQISLGEAALLAALIRSPGTYSPLRHADAAKMRRDVVLAKMLARGDITAAEHHKAIAEALPTASKKSSTTAPYFVEFVKAQLRENFPPEILKSEGLRVFTTLEMNWQRAAEKALVERLTRLENDYPKLKANAEKNLKLEGALIAVQPGTGFIRSYVGGRDFTSVQFDHVAQAKRQPGSTFKPFVYLAALDPAYGGGFTPASLLKDEPLKLDNGGMPWSPENYNRTFHGSVRLRVALENSYNVATAWLGDKVGFGGVVRAAKMAGITSELKPYPSLVLGAFEVSPLELALAYTIFPGQGVRAEPVAIRRVVTTDGKVLEKKSVALKPAFRADAIYLMNRLLKGVMDNGTAASAKRLGFTTLAGGKTGTTSSLRDAWFVGYTPDLLALTWVGYDDNTPTGLTGAGAALPIWTDFMKVAEAGHAYQDFTPTANVIIVKVDARTGFLYIPSCGAAIQEYFIKGTEPFEYCDTVSEFEDDDFEEGFD